MGEQRMLKLTIWTYGYMYIHEGC